jgi:hypothetical protein
MIAFSVHFKAIPGQFLSPTFFPIRSDAGVGIEMVVDGPVYIMPVRQRP